MRPRARGTRGTRGSGRGPALLALALPLAAAPVAAASGREPVVLAASPPPGVAVEGSAGSFGLALDLSRTTIADPAAAGLSVLLDGRDVTSACALTASRDVPPSRLEVACRLPTLETGERRAEVRLGGAEGGAAPWAFAWVFSVARR